MRKRKIPSRNRTPGRRNRHANRKAQRVLSVFTPDEQQELLELVLG